MPIILCCHFQPDAKRVFYPHAVFYTMKRDVYCYEG